MTHPVYLRIVVFVLMVSSHSRMTNAAGQAENILKDTGVAGGLVVHVGCDNGRLTAALHAGDGYLVQGLATAQKDIAAAREHVFSRGLSGKVSVDRWRGGALPCVDNLVNLVVVSSPASVGRDELLRVLAPGGTAVFLDATGSEEKSRRIVKPWPDEIDEWTHYLHGPNNNAVARDRVVGAPQREARDLHTGELKVQDAVPLHLVTAATLGLSAPARLRKSRFAFTNRGSDA